jgi:hypothetical protein
LVVCDLSAAPYIDLAGSRMLHELHGELIGRLRPEPEASQQSVPIVLESVRSHG